MRESENVLTNGTVHTTSEYIRCVGFATRMSHILLYASSEATNSKKMVVFWVVTPCFLVYSDVSEETAASIIVYLFDSRSNNNKNVSYSFVCVF